MKFHLDLNNLADGGLISRTIISPTEVVYTVGGSKITYESGVENGKMFEEYIFVDGHEFVYKYSDVCTRTVADQTTVISWFKAKSHIMQFILTGINRT